MLPVPIGGRIPAARLDEPNALLTPQGRPLLLELVDLAGRLGALLFVESATGGTAVGVLLDGLGTPLVHPEGHLGAAGVEADRHRPR